MTQGEKETERRRQEYAWEMRWPTLQPHWCKAEVPAARNPEAVVCVEPASCELEHRKADDPAQALKA